MLAVQCATLRKRDVTLQSRYGTLRSVMKTLQNVTEGLRKRYGLLWSAKEHYRVFLDVTERYAALRERYRTVMENVDFVHH